MQTMYCWRCRRDVPMLDEQEFPVIEALYYRAVRAIREHYRLHHQTKDATFMRQQYRTVLDAYQRMTGHEHETHPSDLMHHRIAQYGPPCRSCGKPLRTPQASYCVACGADRQ